MCFNAEITAFMLVLNLATGLYLSKRGSGWRRTQLFYVFFLMEVLQLIQYAVVDDCSSIINKAVTLLSYIHICFQPLSVNLFLFRNEPNSDVGKLIYRLCILAGVLQVARVPYLLVNYLPSSLWELVPGLPDPALAGTGAVCSWETCCGPQTCTTRGKLHLQWSLPLLTPSYFIPSGFIHFFVFSGPALLAPGVWHPERLAFFAASFFLGPLASQLASYRASGGDPGWRLEWAGVWCLFAGAQCILGVATEWLLGVDDFGVLRPGGAGFLRYKKAAAAGAVFDGRLACEKGKAAAGAAANGDASDGDDVAAARDTAPRGRRAKAA
ncbi:hypothetical protein Rsub_06325 [Raphidocelis subcapitata]|uniref:Uncharacterized protein n=1 Tax=Raphidocelis subcapitata TaxID=307507 RepID=A0A2V0P940_9CHLO|nr:hypothetical protein Rsub_06325 [Raphidocelis subcapitata]|eukprot:GBF93605.1 hypothetical protein Rsub_06325 [Raphidocelis subcapitata]